MKPILYIIAIVLWPVVMYGQISIKYGDNLTGRIDTLGQVDAYQFEAHAGDILWIRMRDVTAVDSYIRLYDPDSNLVAEDWDYGGLASIIDQTLASSGTYLIEASDRNNNDVGDYGVSLHKVNAPTYAQQTECFDNWSASIASHAAVKVYALSGSEGDVLYAQMRAATVNLEPQFFLYHESGQRVERSVRSGGLAKIRRPLPRSGRYYLLVMDQGGNDHDDFGFSTQLLNQHHCAGSISCGQTISGNLSSLAARQAFQLKMSAGEHGLLQLRSPEASVEASYEIYDEAGELVWSASGSDKLIDASLTATETTSYLIIAQDLHGNDLGTYGMHYESITYNRCAQEILCESSHAFDHSITGVAQLRTYQIEGVAGAPWSFSVREMSPDMEPHIRVFDQAGLMLAEAFGAEKAVVEGVFERSGPYYLLVGDKSGNDVGDYHFEASFGDSEVLLPASYIVDVPGACARIIPYVAGIPISFLWSTGETTATIDVCPTETTVVELQVTFASGCVEEASTVVEYTVIPPACDVIDFNAVPTGTQLSDQLGIVVVSVDNNQGPNIGTIFNSSNPPDHCEDLGTPNVDFGGPGIGRGGSAGEAGENSTAQEQLLIIAENDRDQDNDGLLDDPDDDSDGGTITLDFTKLVDILSVRMIDIEEEGSYVKLYDKDLIEIVTIDALALGDNSSQLLPVDVTQVFRMVVKFKGSGALDDISYCESTTAGAPSENRSPMDPMAVVHHAANSAPHLEPAHSAPASDSPVAVSLPSTLYPNPTQGEFAVTLSTQHKGDVRMRIYDARGRLVGHRCLHRASSDPSLVLDPQQHPPGIYLVALRSEEFVEVQKLQLSRE